MSLIVAVVFCGKCSYMNLQPILQDDFLLIRPLRADDFDALYAVASDPAVWDQHPNKNRYQRAVFETFFQGAVASGGGLIVIRREDGEVLGGTRFYDWDADKDEVLIGYTFFGRNFWGQGINHRVKKLMLEYAFQFVSRVIFHIGAGNLRSQRSIEKLGAKNVGEQQVTYYGEEPKLNVVYEITRSWLPAR